MKYTSKKEKGIKIEWGDRKISIRDQTMIVGTDKAQIITGAFNVRIVGIRIHQTPEKAAVVDKKGEHVIAGPNEETWKNDREMRNPLRGRIR